jgi:hypothetical protein
MPIGVRQYLGNISLVFFFVRSYACAIFEKRFIRLRRRTKMLRLFALGLILSIFALPCCAQSNTQVYSVTGPVTSLEGQLGTLSDTPNPSHPPLVDAKTLVINPQPKVAQDLLKNLGADTTKATIIHVLRWKDANHTSVSLEKWYFYDPKPPKGAFYLQTKLEAFQRTAIPGYQDLQFVFVHINSSLTGGIKEWSFLPSTAADATAAVSGGSVTTIMLTGGGSGYKDVPPCMLSGGGGSGATCTATLAGGSISSISVDSGGTGYTSAPDVVLNTLLHPVSYTITVTKAQTQFIQDLKTALQVLGVGNLSSLTLAAAPLSYGYFGISSFQSQWTTSSITVAASLNSSGSLKTQGTSQNAKGTGTSNSLSSNTYANEKPSYVGLSAGVQVTSYKDVTFQSSSGTLVPSSITKQNVYFFLDGYYPGVLPSLRSFRYIPHPFFGLPIKGEVLRHSMLGVGVGMHWLEPFGGVVFDTQNNQVKNGSISTRTGISYRYVFGLKLSMTAVGKALASK